MNKSYLRVSLMCAVFLTACNAKNIKPKNDKTQGNTSSSYLIKPAVTVNLNDGVSKQEAKSIYQKIAQVYHLPQVAYYLSFRAIKNYWVADTYAKSKPRQIWIDRKTGAMQRGYQKVITLHDLMAKSSDVKRIRTGTYQLYPAINIATNNGINKEEANLILEMYRQVSIGNTTIYYSSPVSEGAYWVSKKKGHFGYQRMKYPVKINKATGDVTHGKVHYKLDRLYSASRRRK